MDEGESLIEKFRSFHRRTYFHIFVYYLIIRFVRDK